MNRLLSIALAALIGVSCSSSTTSPADSGDAGASGGDSGSGKNDAGSPGQDSGSSGSDGGDSGGGCTPPQGATCPTTAGNCKGIGKPCTKGGGQCMSGTSCDIDLDPSGNSICITYLTCVPSTGACGTGATCCKTAMTQNVAVCLPNQCIPSDCTAEP